MRKFETHTIDRCCLEQHLGFFFQNFPSIPRSKNEWGLKSKKHDLGIFHFYLDRKMAISRVLLNGIRPKMTRSTDTNAENVRIFRPHSCSKFINFVSIPKIRQTSSKLIQIIMWRNPILNIFDIINFAKWWTSGAIVSPVLFPVTEKGSVHFNVETCCTNDALTMSPINFS